MESQGKISPLFQPDFFLARNKIFIPLTVKFWLNSSDFYHISSFIATLPTNNTVSSEVTANILESTVTVAK